MTVLLTLELTDWIRQHGHVCQGIGTEAPHPARVLCSSCAQAWHRAASGRSRR